MAKRRKVISTPFLLQGYKLASPEDVARNSLPPENAGPIPRASDVVVPEGYVRTYQGWVFTMDAWSEYSKKIPTQIFLHHTAGHQRQDRAEGTINGWNKRNGPNQVKKTKKNPTGRSHGSTTCVIDGDGALERCVPENRKAHSEGVANSQWSVSVELMALGWFDKFDKENQQWYRESSYGKTRCPKGKAVDPVGFDLNPLPTGYRGYPKYHQYSTPMVDTCIKLIKEWCYRYNIKFIFNQKAYDDMFPSKNNTPLLRKTTKGVFTHNSVKKSSEKTDVFPDPYLIQQLKKHFGRSDKFNPTVSSYDESAKLPRSVPPWNPTKMEIGNFKGGWDQTQDKIQIPLNFPNHKY